MYGPILEGNTKTNQPVRLRPPRESDAELLIAWMADMEVTKTLGRIFPMSLGSEREWLEKQANDQNSTFWIIEFGDDLQPVGVTGIHDISPIHHNATTGTFIGEKKFWKQGIASAVMQLRTEFAFTQLNLHKLNSSYLDGNTGSAKAQALAGFREVGRRKEEVWRNGKWVDEVLTEVLAADWLAANS